MRFVSYGCRYGARILLLMALVLTSACQQEPTTLPSGLSPETIADTRKSGSSIAAQMLLINQGSLPGFYAVCQLDGTTLPYKLPSGEYIERQLDKIGFHRVKCAVKALSIQVSFECEHSFEVFSNEPVYLSLSGRTLPGTCQIERISLLPEDFHQEYNHANEPLPR